MFILSLKCAVLFEASQRREEKADGDRHCQGAEPTVDQGHILAPFD
jgi:hypothetical protein